MGLERFGGYVQQEIATLAVGYNIAYMHIAVNTGVGIGGMQPGATCGCR